MNRLLFAVLVTGLGMTACNNSSSSSGSTPIVPASQASIPALSAGSYTVISSGDTAEFGEAFYDRNGNALLALSSDDRASAQAMIIRKDSVTTRNPKPLSFVAVEYLSSQSDGFLSLDPANVSGSHSALIAGQVVDFSLDASGNIAAGGSACKLSGKLESAKPMGQGITASLNFSGCTSLAGKYDGVAFSRGDIAPASFHLLASNGSDMVDFFAYR